MRILFFPQRNTYYMILASGWLVLIQSPVHLCSLCFLDTMKPHHAVRCQVKAIFPCLTDYWVSSYSLHLQRASSS